MRVKICGIRNIKDAELAINCGADAIGLLVGQKHISNDFITKEIAQEIVKNISPYVSPVLVTHLESAEEIIQLILSVGVNTVQIHSDCNVENVAKVRDTFPYLKIIKNFHANHLTINELLLGMQDFASIVDAYILDTINLAENKVGGTGITHDWSISSEVVRQTNLPIILAGGLNPDNVATAIQTVNPFCVDVNSGVKNSKGFKDPSKLIAFIKNAKFEFFKRGCQDYC